MAVPEKPGKEIQPLAGKLTLATLGNMSPFSGKLVGEAKPPAEPLSLWYRQPAQKWSEALPIGNGRLGCHGLRWLGTGTDPVQ